MVGASHGHETKSPARCRLIGPLKPCFLAPPLDKPERQLTASRPAVPHGFRPFSLASDGLAGLAPSGCRGRQVGKAEGRIAASDRIAVRPQLAGPLLRTMVTPDGRCLARHAVKTDAEGHSIP